MASKRLPFILSSSSHLIFNRSALSQVNNPLNVRVFFTFGGFGEGGKEKPEDNTQSKGVEVSWALCAVPRKGLESRENLCASQRDTWISLPSLAASKRSLGAEGRGEGGGIESVPPRDANHLPSQRVPPAAFARGWDRWIGTRRDRSLTSEFARHRVGSGRRPPRAQIGRPFHTNTQPRRTPW